MYNSGINFWDYLEMNGAMNADRETKDRLRDEFRKLYLAEYQRERRKSLTPVIVEFTEDEMRSIVPRSNEYGKSLSPFLKDIVLGSVDKMKTDSREVLELKSAVSTASQLLTLVKDDILNSTKRSMVEQHLEKLNQLTTGSNDP